MASPSKNISHADRRTEHRISEVEHEHIFKAIPKERPTSQPPPETRNVRNSLTISSDTGTVKLQLHESKSVIHASHDGEGGDLKHHKSGFASNSVSRHDLYKEAIYTCVHMLGRPSAHRFPSSQEDMCLYAHGVFSESPQEQETVLEHVTSEPHPLTIVNVNVRRATGLKGAKPDGLVDPYSVITIETEDSLGKKEWQHFSTESPIKRKSKELAHLRSMHKQLPPEDRDTQIYEHVPGFIKTSVMRHNKDPKWNQRFQCLALRPSVDKLTIEIWDHSIDEKQIAKAIRNSPEPPSISEVDTTLKEMKVDRKKGDIFLGKVSVRISEIPCDGVDSWHHLTGTPHTKDAQPHGKLRLQIWLVHAYRHGRHFTEVAEPRVILSNLWDWILKNEKSTHSDPANWGGSIPSAATCLLFQYALQSGISEDTHAIIRWNAYAKHDLNLSNVESRLHELSGAINKKDLKGRDIAEQLPSERLQDSQADIEDNIMDIVRSRICPIIRNHLKEHADTVHEALRSYLECIQILSKFEQPFSLKKVEWLVESALRMCILEWYKDVHSKNVQIEIKCKLVDKHEYVTSMCRVMKEVNALLQHGEMKWSPEFWLTASMEYLPIVYDELQKMVIHDVEGLCEIFFESPPNYPRMRQILLENDEHSKSLCTALFELYVQTQLFIFARNDIFPSGEKLFCELHDYSRWFRPALILWLGFAIVRGSMMISKTINIDNYVQENQHAMTSSSALDTANVFWQLVNFWNALNWPDIAEGYVIINFLMDVMCSYTILYADMKHAKLEKQGYYDPNGKFTISERLCTALNNIEYVKRQTQTIPQMVNYDKLIERLEETCGKSTLGVSYEVRAQERMDQTLLIVDKHIEDILNNVGLRIQREMSAFIDETLKSLLEMKDDELHDAMEPILAYLEDSIVTLQNSLLSHNFRRILLLLWNLVCRGLKFNSSYLILANSNEQDMFFKKMIRVIPFLQSYFEGGDAGLSIVEMQTKDYDEMSRLFHYFTMDTNKLISIYYSATAQIHMNYQGSTPFGSLRVRVGYWNKKLGVEIISASDLTPHDEPLIFFKCFQKHHPTSDAMVELELKPNAIFPNEKKYVTDVKWNNLNPVFEQTFYWSITADDCTQPSAVLVLTVKDYDLLNKNEFLGEAIIPLHLIPGISSSPEPQPMNLKLHEVNSPHETLIVLKSRTWDTKAKGFSREQLARYVEPLIVRTKDPARKGVKN